MENKKRIRQRVYNINGQKLEDSVIAYKGDTEHDVLVRNLDSKPCSGCSKPMNFKKFKETGCGNKKCSTNGYCNGCQWNQKPGHYHL